MNIQTLIKADHALFALFNTKLSGGIVGQFFVLMTRLGDWAAIWLIICALVLWRNRGDEESHRTVVLTIAALLVSELVTGVLKNAIGRMRPEQVLGHVTLLAGKATTYSFPSAHTVRSFAAATVLSRHYRRRRWPLYALATLIGVSRIVVGLHFPSDVAAAATIGLLIGWAMLGIGTEWERAGR